MFRKCEQSDDNNYLNAYIVPSTSQFPGPVIARYEETFTQAVLQNPSEYYLSIIRFSVPLDELPLIICPVDITQNNPNVTPWTFGILLAGTRYIVNVVYTPDNTLTAPTPSGSLPYWNSNQLNSQYYYVFSVTQIISMFNTAVAAAITAAGGLAGGTVIYSWDPITELISVTVNAAFITSGAKLFMNNLVENYLTSFRLKTDTTVVGQIYYEHIFPVAGGPFTIPEDFTAMSNWFDVRKLVFVSNSIGLNPEIVPVQDPFSGDLLQGQVTSQNILTDFLVSPDSVNQYVTVAQYIPTSQYRLINMTQTVPLQRIDFQIYFQTKTGVLLPLYISYSQEVTVKFGFFKKSLYKASLTTMMK